MLRELIRYEWLFMSRFFWLDFLLLSSFSAFLLADFRFICFVTLILESGS